MSGLQDKENGAVVYVIFYVLSMAGCGAGSYDDSLLLLLLRSLQATTSTFVPSTARRASGLKRE